MNPSCDIPCQPHRRPTAAQRFRRALLPFAETVALWLSSRIVPRLSRRSERRPAHVLGAAMARIPTSARWGAATPFARSTQAGMLPGEWAAQKRCTARSASGAWPVQAK